MNKFINKFDFDLFWSYINNFIGLILSLIVSLLILKYLNSKEFAVYIIFNSLFALINVLVSAISPNVSRNIALINFNKDSCQFNELTRGFNFIVKIVIMLVIILFTSYLFYYNKLEIFADIPEKNLFFLLSMFSFIFYTRYSFSSSAIRGMNLIKIEQRILTLSQISKSFISVIILFFYKSILFFPISIFFYVIILNSKSIKYLRQYGVFFNLNILSTKLIINKYTEDIFKSSFFMLVGNLGNYLFLGLVFLILITIDNSNSSLIANYQYVIVISSVASTLFYRHQINFIEFQDYKKIIYLFKKLVMIMSLLFFTLMVLYFFFIDYIFLLVGKKDFIISKTILIVIFLNSYIDTILIGFSLLLSSKKIFVVQNMYLIVSIVYLLLAYYFDWFINPTNLLLYRIFFLTVILIKALFSFKIFKNKLLT